MAETYLPPKAGYKVKGAHLESDGTIQGKVTGTMMGGILGISPWSSSFQVACTLLGLASKDISDKPAVKAGVALEGKIIEYMGARYPEYGMFVPAEEIFEKREGDHDSWASDFDDPYFAGHVDGIVMTEDGLNYILEVKTSSNMDSWANGVPEYYYWQVALYNTFVAKQDHAYVALGIMNPEALKDPSTWVPSDDNTGLFIINFDQEKINQTLDEVMQWYDTYIGNNITPDYDPTNPRDVELYNHLVDLTQEETDVQELTDQLVEVEAVLAEREEELRPLQELKDTLRARIKDYMDCHGLTELDSIKGDYRAVITKSTRKKIDASKLKEAGIDPEPFTVTTEVKSFTLKRNKE